MTSLTYCSNIHPGESWADVLRNLDSHVPAVKQAVSPRHSFPIGLWLSNQAANELDSGYLGRFRDWCNQHDCFVLTANAFPYGKFHQRTLKQSVYDPDWRASERVQYSKRVADVLSQFALEGSAVASMSTVPIAYKAGFRDSDWGRVRQHLIEVLQHLDDIRQRRGVQIRLAIEPEPMCVLETTTEAIDFFERMSFPDALADLVGLCFDCCHQAVEFEQPADCLRRLTEAGIDIVKVQVSSALRASADLHDIHSLLQFDEPVYLHQAVARLHDGRLLRFADLPDLAAYLQQDTDIEECRVHFHVPIFLEQLGSCGTTRPFLEDFLPRLDSAIPLEVETYSFHVLPEGLRMQSVGESIARELLWVRQLLNDRNEAAVAG